MESDSWRFSLASVSTRRTTLSSTVSTVLGLAVLSTSKCGRRWWVAKPSTRSNSTLRREELEPFQLPTSTVRSLAPGQYSCTDSSLVCENTTEHHASVAAKNLLKGLLQCDLFSNDGVEFGTRFCFSNTFHLPFSRYRVLTTTMQINRLKKILHECIYVHCEGFTQGNI